MVDRIGQQLGNYRIIRPIGHGGFADVYLGEHIYLQTQVAIKLLQMRLAEEDMEGFLKEARTIAHLVHPHIVRVLGFGIEGGTPFLVMDYAPNGTLRQRHPRGTTLPLTTITSYVKQVADALQYAHEKKLIHRDIKPENMLLGENHQVLLSDFGIALIAQSTRYQNTQEVMGTAAYMAPEQLQGKPRRASDQYSLGIVVYEWLSGDRPFHGSFTEIYSQHMFVPPPSLREKIPGLPPAVEEVVLTALAKDPKERFATIQAFATALEQACQAGLSRPIALQSELPSPSQPLSPSDTVAAFPLSQVSGPPAATSAPPTKVPSTTPLAESFSASHLPNYENTTSVPKTKSNSAIANRYQGLHISRIVLPIGLALLVLIGSLGLFNIMRTNQMTTGNAYATATAQTNATNIANTATIMAQVNAAATATATTLYNNYVQATSGTPVLDDPLRDNSQGWNWAEGDGVCAFTGGAYHAIMAPTFNGALGCFAHSTHFSNFAYQVQMTIIRGDGGGGLLFRTGGKDNFGYQFQVAQGGSSLIYDGTTFNRSTAIKAKLNQTYSLTVIARGNTINAYIDKQWVGSAEDSTASSGGIALEVFACWGCGGGTKTTEVVFGNAKIWNL